MILEKEKLISLLYPVEMFTLEDLKVLINARCTQITDSNGRFSFLSHGLFSRFVQRNSSGGGGGGDLGFP